jgi:hypothetical protein
MPHVGFEPKIAVFQQFMPQTARPLWSAHTSQLHLNTILKFCSSLTENTLWLHYKKIEEPLNSAREIIVVYSKNHMKRLNTCRGRSADLLWSCTKRNIRQSSRQFGLYRYVLLAESRIQEPFHVASSLQYRTDKSSYCAKRAYTLCQPAIVVLYGCGSSWWHFDTPPSCARCPKEFRGKSSRPT